MTEHAGPEQMRSAMAEYVQAVHGAYIDAANALPPGDRARLPLFTADTFTVIVAGTRYLHVLATTDKLPAPAGPEVSLGSSSATCTGRFASSTPSSLPASASSTIT